MPTLEANTQRTATLTPGQVLRITATSAAVGSVVRLPSSGNTDYGSPFPIAGIDLVVGPFATQTALRIELTAGSVTYEIAGSTTKQALQRIAATARTLTRDDRATMLASTSASATTFTVPPLATAAWELGDTIIVSQLGAGLLTIAAGAGVTIRKVATMGLTISAQYGVAQLQYIGPDEWLIFGSLGAA